jgi:hypothetical protein
LGSELASSLEILRETDQELLLCECLPTPAFPSVSVRSQTHETVALFLAGSATISAKLFASKNAASSMCYAQQLPTQESN